MPTHRPRQLLVPLYKQPLKETPMSTPPLAYAVYVADECMARFVHAPDAAHYRQQLIHRIQDEAPDSTKP